MCVPSGISICAFLLTFALSPLCAQEQIQRQNRPSEQTQQAPTKTAKPHQLRGKQATITGCLQKGSELNEYTITGENGKKYVLRSTTIKLGDHIGHKVKVKGNLRPEGAKNESAGESDILNATSLEMLSDNCP